ncbi:alpha/beta fold hydrolase [Variovorax sp. Sphag1AA]|uniref:alpha/beta fold hydrolase n=1 Tax=Variovorax sp. Sphag1AA TaxID=2587027 RepID=UPI00161FA106|nr:alpha/beta hydrolase [Variovorax sp. Sphag1AA]MBB3175810.1 pimeloyl-ACP methyl ester carboxylesterase [Variovorax sp. Sphag1AA]
MPYFSTFEPLAEAEAVRLIERVDALATHHDVEHGGVRVRWRRFGKDSSNPPLVLLHGGHGSWMHWLRNVEALSAAHTLWLPDMPGFNDSNAMPEPAAGQSLIDAFLDTLRATLDTLVGAETEIDLGGFSFGGLIASKLGARRGRIRRMILMGSGGHGTLRRMTVEMINWRAASDRDEERAALLHNLAALMLHDKASIDALAFAIHDISCHGTRFRSKEISLSGGLQVALETIGGPQLLVWGEHDVTADSRPLVAQLVKDHPLREGTVIDGAGHWVQFERADEVNARVLRFLSESRA